MVVSDAQIVEILRENKNKGFNILFKRYYKPLVFFSSNIVQNLSTAEDLVQDFFLSFFRLKTYDKIDSHALSTYLFRSVKNLSINSIKSKDVLFNKLDLLDIDIMEEESIKLNDNLVSSILIEIDKLPTKTKMVVKGVVLHGLKYKEVAEENDVSINTIKTLLKSGLKVLRSKFNAYAEVLFVFFFKKVN